MKIRSPNSYRGLRSRRTTNEASGLDHIRGDYAISLRRNYLDLDYTMTLYNMKSTPDGYRMVKFDDYLNVEAVYEILYRRGRFYCDCPQGQKSHTCKHRELITTFTGHRAVNSGKFYCLETANWEPKVDF